MSTPSASSDRFKILFNFFAVYVIWGSTYLGIKFAIESFPPFLLAGLRYLFAGLILLAFGRLKREAWISRRDLAIASLSGFLLVMANALVCYAEERLATGIIAIVIGTMPGWIMLLNWKFFDRVKPTLRQAGGLVVALIGITLLSKNELSGGANDSIVSWLAIGLSMLSWALGTLIQRRSGSTGSFFIYSSAQLSMGGALLLITLLFFPGTLALDVNAITPRALGAFVYLTLFGSVIAFTSYLWLSRRVSPTVVSTYALVNPVVAMLLGVAFANETVSLKTLFYSVFIVFGLYFVLIKKKAPTLATAEPSRVP